MGRVIAFLLLVVICGVLFYLSFTGYRVTAARYYDVTKPARDYDVNGSTRDHDVTRITREDCNEDSCSMVDFTIRHGWNHIIQAECEAFDTRNECSKIQVGKRYSFERSDNTFHFLSLTKEGTRVTMAITSEHN